MTTGSKLSDSEQSIKYSSAYETTMEDDQIASIDNFFALIKVVDTLADEAREMACIANCLKSKNPIYIGQALQKVAENNQVKYFEFILQQFEHQMDKSYIGVSLQVAAAKGSVDVVKLLVRRNRKDLTQENLEKAIYYSSQFNHDDTVGFLLEKVADKMNPLDIADAFKNTVANNNIPLVHRFLNTAGCRIKPIIKHDKACRSFFEENPCVGAKIHDDVVVAERASTQSFLPSFNGMILDAYYLVSKGVEGASIFMADHYMPRI